MVVVAIIASYNFISKMDALFGAILLPLGVWSAVFCKSRSGTRAMGVE
jgi:hypothetical protein